MLASRMHQQKIHKPLWHFFSSQQDCRHLHLHPSTLEKAASSRSSATVSQKKLSLEKPICIKWTQVLCFASFCQDKDLLQQKQSTEICRCARWKTEAELVAPQLSLHLDAKDHSFMLFLCSTLRTCSSYEKPYHEVTWPWRNPLGSLCVSPTVCCQSLSKETGSCGFCGLTVWDAEPP